MALTNLILHLMRQLKQLMSCAYSQIVIISTIVLSFISCVVRTRSFPLSFIICAFCILYSISLFFIAATRKITRNEWLKLSVNIYMFDLYCCSIVDFSPAFKESPSKLYVQTFDVITQSHGNSWWFRVTLFKLPESISLVSWATWKIGSAQLSNWPLAVEPGHTVVSQSPPGDSLCTLLAAYDGGVPSTYAEYCTFLQW